MSNRSVRRVLATTILAAAAGLGGVAAAGSASALDNPPSPGSAGCTHNGTAYKHRAVVEINGYWYECQNGTWVKQSIFRGGTVSRPGGTTTGTMAWPK